MSEAIEQIAVGKLRLADDQIREGLGDLTELAASIKAEGVLEPLLVREDGLVVCGSRRLQAAIKAGLKAVPAMRGSYTDEQRLTVMAIENLQRQSLTPLEEARVFQRLSALDLTTRQVAAKLGVSQSWVSKRLALLKLPEATQAWVATGKLDLSAASELVKLADDPKLVERLAKKASEGNGRYMGHEVQVEVERRDRAKEVAAKEKELEKAGETVVRLIDSGYITELPKGTAIVSRGYYPGSTVVRIDPEKHKTMACHAVGVHPRTRELVECCTAPGKHPDPEKERQAEAAKRDAELAAARQREQALYEHRVAFLKAAAVKPSKELVIDVCYMAIVGENNGYSYADGELAIELLGVAEQPEKGEEEDESISQIDSSSWYEQQVAELGSTPGGKLRVLFAFAVDQLAGWRALEPVLDLLGYEPPKAELTVVKQGEEVAEAA